MSSGRHLPLRRGQAFNHGGTKLVYHGLVDHRLHITDTAGNIFLAFDTQLGGDAMPDEFWLWQEFLNGSITTPRSVENRHERLQRLDIAAAIVRDPTSLKRYTWGRMAQKAKLPQNQAKVQAWIDNTPIPAVPGIQFSAKGQIEHQEIQRKLAADFAVKPKARSVMEWKKWADSDLGIAPFINGAGRAPGQSQLPPKVDLLVARATELYWSNQEDFASMEDAAAIVLYWWEKLKSEGENDLGAAAPVYETVRQRIRKSENFENFKLRYGDHVARAKFAPKGEPIPVTRPFERIYMDGTEFEHYTRYSNEWQELAGKMKGIAAMDAYSLFRWPYSIFYGPFRPEMSIEALMHVFMPNPASAADLQADPTSLIFGNPVTVTFDNDKALLPPSFVPHLALLSEVELLGVYFPNGKSPLEGSFKHDKQQLARIKGQVLPPRRNKDPRYNPANGPHLTKAQYAARVEKVRRNWNATPKTSLGERSPNDVMLEYIRTTGRPILYGR